MVISVRVIVYMCLLCECEYMSVNKKDEEREREFVCERKFVCDRE